ncbi:MAG TPA: hypothetical protein VI455_19000 [Terriglobia bacterium]
MRAQFQLGLNYHPESREQRWGGRVIALGTTRIQDAAGDREGYGDSHLSFLGGELNARAQGQNEQKKDVLAVAHILNLTLDGTHHGHVGGVAGGHGGVRAGRNTEAGGEMKAAATT